MSPLILVVIGIGVLALLVVLGSVLITVGDNLTSGNRDAYTIIFALVFSIVFLFTVYKLGEYTVQVIQNNMPL